MNKEEIQTILHHSYIEVSDKLIFFNRKLIKHLIQEKYEDAAKLRDLILDYIVDESKLIQNEIGGRVSTYKKTLIEINNTIIQELQLKYLYNN